MTTKTPLQAFIGAQQKKTHESGASRARAVLAVVAAGLLGFFGIQLGPVFFASGVVAPLATPVCRSRSLFFSSLFSLLKTRINLAAEFTHNALDTPAKRIFPHGY